MNGKRLDDKLIYCTFSDFMKGQVMKLSSRKRMEMALSFQQADRVPIEIQVTPTVRSYPEANKLVELVDSYSDNFKSYNSIDWGFYGVPSVKKIEQISKSKEYTYSLNTFTTADSIFSGIMGNDSKNPSYWYWKKHFIENTDDLKRFANSRFPKVEFASCYLDKLDSICADKHTPLIQLHHPFGTLARISPPEEFYIWLHTEKDLIHKLFEKQYSQINDFIKRLKAPFMFGFTAFEMAIEPWISREMFDEFIYPYDKEMNTNIHHYGGMVRHHCHGPVFNHLKHWADMGVDSLEPLEMKPFGDTDLGKAKKVLGNRMSLAGNIPSQSFVEIEHEEIERMVENAISTGAEGGGYILRGASLVCGLNSFKNEEQLDKMISATICFIESGLKFGQY